MIKRLENEIEELTKKAESADSKPLQDGLTVPEEINRRNGPTVFCAIQKTGHHRTVEDLEKKSEPVAPPEGSDIKEIMEHRLRTKEGRERYKLRKETVEPVFGIIKHVMKFKQFLLRGEEKVGLEWDLITLAYNLKRLHKMNKGVKLSTLV